jgi:hypothetical protein
MPSGVYGIAKYRIGLGSMAWASGAVVRAMLMGPAYTFSASHRYVADVLANEVVDASYARQPLTGRTTSFDIPLSRGLLSAEPTRFSSIENVTVLGAVLYERIGTSDSTPGDDPLICYLEFPSPFVADGTDLLVRYDPQGVITLT